MLGTAWSDDNRDGIRDETSGMTDVEVRLLDADGNVAASTRTRYHDRYFSMYLFGPLPPGGVLRRVHCAGRLHLHESWPGQPRRPPLDRGRPAGLRSAEGEAVVRGAG
ncbi:hypothetical protein [Methanoculleus chikugoensis]|uniref:hypothetical protein n=1 Tax=Methanoculleus chikugoensis TaxID=118126 RepID=UPI0006D1398E|nr:hypothetical protein [Methanoculleus chikugoensis]